MAEQLKSEIAIEWIEEWLIVPGGDHTGERLKLVEFQKDILRKVFDNPHVTLQAIISMPRGAAKSTLCAMILALYLVGPFVKRNTTLVSTAMTREQASEVYKLLANMTMMNPKLAKYIHPRENKKQLVNKHLNISFTALSSDAKDKQGGAAYIAIHDEVGSIRGPYSELISAVDGGMAKNKGSISFYISTQAGADNDLYSRLIDTYKDGADPHVVCIVYKTPDDVDPLSEEALEHHPAYSTFADKVMLRSQQNKARLMPHLLSHFRQYFLNQRVDADEGFITRELWSLNSQEPEDWKGKEVYISLDLSDANDLTCITIMFKNEKDDRYSIVPFFFLPKEGIREKSKSDRIQWDVWAEQGHLILTTGKTVGMDVVAEKLLYINENAKIKQIAYDRWKIKAFKKDLVQAGASESWIEEKFFDFPNNMRGMTPAIRVLQWMLLNELIAHGNHPILTLCFFNIKVVRSSGSSNLMMFDKKSVDRKIDGAVATAMCVGIIQGIGAQKTKPKSYLETEDLFII